MREALIQRLVKGLEFRRNYIQQCMDNKEESPEDINDQCEVVDSLDAVIGSLVRVLYEEEQTFEKSWENYKKTKL